MSPEEFRAACLILWGPSGWPEGAAAFLRVSKRNVYYFAAGSKVVPPGIAGELAAEVSARLADGDDRTPAISFLRSALAPTAAGG